MCGKDERRLADRRQLHEAHTVLERLDELGRCGDRQARLADSAGAGERDEPRALRPQQAQQVVELVLTPEQPRRLDRQTPLAEAPERRKLVAAELEEPD